MTSKTAYSVWSFLVMGCSIFTFVWLVSITHNVTKSWVFHAVDHQMLLEIDHQCANGGAHTATFDLTSTGQTAGHYGDAEHGGVTIQNASCVVDAIETWQANLATERATVDGRAHYVSDYSGAGAGANEYKTAQADSNFATLSGLAEYENGANTSVITALIFTSIAMIVGVANFVILLISSSRYMMMEALFCFCAGFGAVIVISSPWIADIVVDSAGTEYVALPIITALQITLLWVKPGPSTGDSGVEDKNGFVGF